MKIRLKIAWYGNPAGAVIEEPQGVADVLIARAIAEPHGPAKAPMSDQPAEGRSLTAPPLTRRMAGPPEHK